MVNGDWAVVADLGEEDGCGGVLWWCVDRIEVGEVEGVEAMF